MGSKHSKQQKNKLINNKKQIHNNQQHIKLKDEDFYKLLIDGYIRDIQKNSFKNKTIPLVINEICFNFFDIFISYKGKFISENINKNMQIINEHEIIFTQDTYQSAKLNNPILTSTKRIYKWCIMIDHNVDCTNNLDS